MEGFYLKVAAGLNLKKLFVILTRLNLTATDAIEVLGAYEFRTGTEFCGT
jgi:hypothetical protein